MTMNNAYKKIEVLKFYWKKKSIKWSHFQLHQECSPLLSILSVCFRFFFKYNLIISCYNLKKAKHHPVINTIPKECLLFLCFANGF